MSSFQNQLHSKANNTAHPRFFGEEVLGFFGESVVGLT